MQSFRNMYSLATILHAMADEAGAGVSAADGPSEAGSSPAVPLPAVIAAGMPSLKQFNDQSPAEFGNSYLESLLKVDDMDRQIAEASEMAEGAKRFIHFELTKAVMSAAEKGKDINLFAVFEGNKPVEKLNSKILQYFGVIERKVDPDADEIVVSWSSPAMADAYDYSSLDKEKDKNEYDRRFNNRKRLNLRLSEAYKVGCGLLDVGVNQSQLKLVEDATTKQVTPIIENAPPALRGDTEKNKSPDVKFGQRSAQDGATVAPNIAALARAATEAHKKADPNATGIAGQRADTGSDRSGDAKLGMSDEDFGGIVNNLRRAIMAQEGKLTEEMQKQLVALVPFIDEELKKALELATQAKLDDLSDDDSPEAEAKRLEDLDNAGGEKPEQEAAPAKKPAKK